MTPSHRSPLLAFPMICSMISLLGCAVSPIVDSDGGDRIDEDSGLMSSEAPTTETDGNDDDGNEPGIDPNGDLNGGGASSPAPTSSQKPDASSASDAGSAPFDASAKDAGSSSGAIADAGRQPTGVTDSGSPAPTPTSDAGQSAIKPAAGKCKAASDCTASCVPIGILNCCRDNGTCGCTWAPGAYCS